MIFESIKRWSVDDVEDGSGYYEDYGSSNAGGDGGPRHVWDVVLLSDETVLTCLNNYTIKRWSLKGELLRTYSVFEGKRTSILKATQLDRWTFVSCLGSKYVQIWDIETGSMRDSGFNFSSGSSFCVLGLRDGRLCVGDSLGSVLIRDLSTHTSSIVLMEPVGRGSDSSVTCLCELREGRFLASGTSNGKVCIIASLKQTYPQCIKVLDSGKKFTVRQIAEVTPGDASEKSDLLIACACGDRTIRIWNAMTKECTAVLREHTSQVMSISMLSSFVGGLFGTSGNQNLFCTGSWDQTIRFWNARTGIMSGSRVRISENLLAIVSAKSKHCIVTVNSSGTIEVFRYVPRLIDACCRVVAQSGVRREDLAEILPAELCDACLMFC